MGRKTPKWKSALFEDAETETGATTCVNAAPPVLAHRPTVPPLKLISYAKLYQVPGTKEAGDQREVPPAIHCKLVALGLIPNFN